MKRLFFVILIVGVGLAVNANLKKNTQNICDLVSANIECLAQNEDEGGLFCLGYGSIDCLGDKMKYKVSGLSLPLNE